MTYHYIARHEFNNGEESYEFTTPVVLRRFFGNGERLAALAQKLGINFEPHRHEFLHVSLKEDDTIVMHLTETDVKEIMDAGQ
jgi:hypothetical protein